ncbi:MAG: GLPGLI family protein [Saprospiraceae bacterium]|nr:GLPGLI family protein [Saprospiraceae bacterium]
MKHLLSFIFILCLCCQLSSQTEGKIVYKETIKFDFEFEGMDESMKSMMPESQSVDKELVFNSKESLWQNKKGEAMEGVDLKSDDGSFHIKIMVDDTEDIYYKSFDTNTKYHQRGLMGKSFVVKDEMEKHKWKITNEKVKYLDYECQKAVIENEDDFIVAWFTPQIPSQIGPGGLHGLPGAILMANYNDGEREVMAQSVDFYKLEKGDIKIPNNGKKVSEAEFAKIEEEKQKEMEMMYGSGNIIRERR